jgi:poly(3-hydroxybutyrate) depolymerase
MGKSKAPPPVAFQHTGQERTYFVYAPDGLSEHCPVVLLLHGSGRDGLSLLQPWRNVADEHGVLLVAPNSASSDQWSPYADDPAFFRAVLADVATQHSFDHTKVVVFGHSAGAMWGLQLGLLDSEQFAAVAVHAGLIPDEALGLIGRARRKVPYQIQIGDRDPFFPTAQVRRTADALTSAGFSVDLVEIPRHDHDYYRIAKKVNRTAWTFFAAVLADVGSDTDSEAAARE